MKGKGNPDAASAVGRYVMSKIIPLQSGYLGKGAGSSTARADLAQLRRLSDPNGIAWMAAGEQLFDGWPEDELGTPEHNDEAFNAVCSSLSFYAMHQQSQEKPMALLRDSDSHSWDWSAGSFGKACREIEQDLDKAKGVQRRLARIEAAQDFDGIVWGMRSLVQLMKAQGIPLDYGKLARDLYYVQFDDSRSIVFRRWGSEYYAQPRQQENNKAETLV